MNQAMEVTYKDSELCTFYEFPSKAFPRFRFIQDNLISFYPRFKRTVENLPDCLKWKGPMKDISKKVERLEQSMPAIILFGEKHSMIQVEQIVASTKRLSENEIKTGRFSRMDLALRVSVDTPQIRVYQCSSDQVVQEIIHLLETELPKTGTDNVLLMIDVEGQYENEGVALREKIIASLTDAPRKFWKDKMIINTVNQAISTKISNHLEMYILKEFKRIDDCIREVLSIRRNMEGISSFERDLLSEVKKFFQNKIVVQDMMNLAYQEKGNEQFLKDQIIWFIQREVSAEFHIQFKMATGYIHAMLEEVEFKEECKTNISATTWLSIESELSETYMESQQSEKPMETDNQTGKKYQKLRKTSVKQEPSDKRAIMLVKDLQPVLKKVRMFLKGVQEGLKTLSQLQIELKVIFRNTIFSPEKEAKRMKKVLDELENWKKKLMELPEVQGCGDHFGNLIIFISKEKSKREEQEVKQKIDMFLTECPYDYDVKYSTKPRTFANPKQVGACNSIFKAGQKIRWRDHDGHVRHGTLGIFVLGKKEQTVYFVTNGHVVIGEGKVDISVKEESYVEFGTEMWSYIGELVDIAAVKVKSNMLSQCMFHFENYYGEQCSYVVLNTSEDTFEQLVGQKVYKRGAETGLRVGIVSSKSIQLKEEGTIKTYSMVISPLPGSKPEKAEFAKEGDSGSVVSLYTADEITIGVIAMIIGGFELKPTQDEKEPSKSQDNQDFEQNEEKLCLSFSLMEGVSALNKTHELDLKIEP
ncbi:hypothetical protein CHS0354_011264 [Potamilus streckersoni]|uniref:Uncharacterized protein n=1 Tax=Potamilus streckersoni TaxID=2493646 RepID=A0AAE0RNE5_9BIVA|nr:hypothetical protein CHS0354_011264 [Potamilus streckersoni]